MSQHYEGHTIDLDDFWDGVSIRSVVLNKDSTRLYGAGQSSHYIFIFDMGSQQVVSKNTKIYHNLRTLGRS
jgi:hypothetical protein